MIDGFWAGIIVMGGTILIALWLGGYFDEN